MPKSDAWPDGSGALESMSESSMDSVGSCDSVVSTSSASNHTNLEHLSAEERACLIFLEETIESLQVEEDGSPSANARDGVHVPVSPAMKTAEHSYPEKNDDMDDEHFTYLAPPPLFLDHSVPSEDMKADVLLSDYSPPSMPPADKADVPIPMTTPPESKLCQSHQGVQSEISLDLIPPPTDFRDDPMQPADLSLIAEPLSLNDLQELHRRASLKKSPPVTPKSNVSPALVDQTASYSTSPSPSESKASPPAVAPKPKKLPSNIILKSQKAPATPQETSPSSVATLPSEKATMDPQKVRKEALRKLGLLKDDEPDPGTHSPGHSPKSFRTSQPPTPPVSPEANSAQSTDDTTGLSLPILRSFKKEPHELKNRQDSAYRLQRCSWSGLSTVDLQQPAKVTSVKSASLESNASDLNSYIASLAGLESLQEPSNAMGNSSLAPQRNPRPRPASLGNTNDFSRIQADATLQNTSTKSQEAVDDKKVLPLVHLHKSSSHNIRRSPGISVVISPHGNVGEDRREALKKLGLLKD